MLLILLRYVAAAAIRPQGRPLAAMIDLQNPVA